MAVDAPDGAAVLVLGNEVLGRGLAGNDCAPPSDSHREAMSLTTVIVVIIVIVIEHSRIGDWH